MNEGRALAERLENAWLAAWTQSILARLAVDDGRLDEARAMLDEALAESVGAHSTTILAFCLGSLARLELEEGDANKAAVLVGAVEGLRRRRGLRAWPILRQIEADLTSEVREALVPNRFERAVAEGSRLSFQEIVGIAGRSPTTTPTT